MTAPSRDPLDEAIAARRGQDPLVGAKIGAEEVSRRLLKAMATDRGVHVESLLAVCGALAGYAWQASLRARARAAGLPTVITPGQRAGKVFIIRWALVPLGESCFDAGTSWAWDTTALRPAGMTASEQELQAYLGPIDALPAAAAGTIGTAVIDQVGGPAGDGGVGALLRQEAGDQLFITLRFPR